MIADYIIYTDGSCLGNPGAGGYAAIIIDCVTGEVIELHGGESYTTNNRMEMTAAIVALSELPAGVNVDLYTDSAYLKNAFTKGWLKNWKRNGWRTSNNTPVLNQELWIELDNLMMTHEINFIWVKGHAGIEYNERCDKLARQESVKYSMINAEVL